MQCCKEVRKSWGRELWIVNHPGPNGYCAKKLLVAAGHICSMHRHLVKNESFIVVAGSGYIEIEGQPPMYVEPGSVVDIEAGTWHRFWTKTGMQILEVSSFHDDKDVERKSASGELRKADRLIFDAEALSL
jgi:mannose-6-phosphate isomerase-like protein (cupin superfamily)